MCYTPITLSKNIRQIVKQGNGGEGFPALHVLFRPPVGRTAPTVRNFIYLLG